MTCMDSLCHMYTYKITVFSMQKLPANSTWCRSITPRAHVPEKSCEQFHDANNKDEELTSESGFLALSVWVNALQLPVACVCSLRCLLWQVPAHLCVYMYGLSVFMYGGMYLCTRTWYIAWDLYVHQQQSVYVCECAREQTCTHAPEHDSCS